MGLLGTIVRMSSAKKKIFVNVDEWSETCMLLRRRTRPPPPPVKTKHERGGSIYRERNAVDQFTERGGGRGNERGLHQQVKIERCTSKKWMARSGERERSKIWV